MLERGEREDFEFDVDAEGGGVALFEGVDGVVEAAFVETRRAGDEDEEFEVVVGGVALGCGEDTAFAAAVAAAEDEGLEEVSGDDFPEVCADGGAGLIEEGLEGGAAVAGEGHAGDWRW